MKVHPGTMKIYSHLNCGQGIVLFAEKWVTLEWIVPMTGAGR